MKLAVVTIAIGAFHERMGQLTHPTHRAYADRIGADFVVIKDMSYHSTPHYAKLDMGDLLNKYDRIIYIDTDIIVRDDTPSLFDIVPEAKFGAVEEGHYSERRMALLSHFKKNAFEPPEDWEYNYFNTGVLVFSKCHQPIFIQPEEEAVNFFEQTHLNMVLAAFKVELHKLPYRFNRMTLFDAFTGEHRLSSYLVHYAGAREAGATESGLLALIQNDLNDWRRAGPGYKYKRNIAISVQGGMGDQIDAEPTIRFMAEVMYKGDNIHVAANWPQIFSHLPVALYDDNRKIPDVQVMHMMQTLRGPDHESWEFMSQPLMNGVDFASLQALRLALPDHRKPIKLVVSPRDSMRMMNALGVMSFGNTVLVHPGRGWPSKTFPKDVWQSYLNALTAADYRVIVMGKRVSAEQGVVEELDLTHCIDAIDKLDFAGMVALVKACPVLVSNDSAPIHVAGAFDNWIGVISTCKRPEHVLPYRGPDFSTRYKTRALEVYKHYEHFDHTPTNIEGETIDRATEDDMLRACPPASTILGFVNEVMGK